MFALTWNIFFVVGCGMDRYCSFNQVHFERDNLRNMKHQLVLYRICRFIPLEKRLMAHPLCKMRSWRQEIFIFLDIADKVKHI